MAVQMLRASRSPNPSLRRAFLGALFAMFWLTVMTSLLLSAVVMLLARSIASLAT